MEEGILNLNTCVERVRQGDQSAACSLVEALSPLVQKIVMANLPYSAAPEDLCQDVFMKLFSKLDQYAGLVPFEHWAARVALNTCRDRLRSQQRSKEVRWADLSEGEAEALDHVTADTATESAAQAVGARDLADRLLATLNPEDQLVVRMIDLEQRTAAEVREVTGWSITGIRVRAFRARRRLRKTLETLKLEVSE